MRDELLKIIYHYGTGHQTRKLNEEKFELLEAIIIYNFCKKVIKENIDIKDYLTIARENIKEEIADTIVVINQFKELLDIKDLELDTIGCYKIERQLKRMEEENGDN